MVWAVGAGSLILLVFMILGLVDLFRNRSTMGTGALVAWTLFIVFVLFPVMGRDYIAAVLGAGFAGFALGATPTAIANMSAVTKQYGAAAQALLILPLVSAFFVDLSNAAIIWLFLG